MTDMGVESYFVTLYLEETDANRNLAVDKLSALLEAHSHTVKELHKKITADGYDKIVIDDIVELWLESDESGKNICLIGCFSCYLESRSLICRTAALIESTYPVKSIKVYGAEISPDDDISEAILEKYRVKYEDFVGRFSNKQYRTYPDNFYNVYCSFGLLNGLKRLFSR